MWEEINTNVAVTTGEWLTFETYFLEGDSTNGRYKVQVTDKQQNTNLLFDVENFTQHPNDFLNNGIASINPMKLYTSAGIIDGMTNSNSELSVYWDEFEFWIDSSLKTNEFNEINELSIFPNPSTNHISIQSENVLNNFFKILDQNGREVLNGKLEGKSTEVSLSKLSKGMYTLQVDGNYKSAVIMKE